jgi:hypothetical protein
MFNDFTFSTVIKDDKTLCASCKREMKQCHRCKIGFATASPRGWECMDCRMQGKDSSIEQCMVCENCLWDINEVGRDMRDCIIENDIQRLIESYLKDGDAVKESDLISMIESTGLKIDLERFRCAAERMVAKDQLSREYDSDLIGCELRNSFFHIFFGNAKTPQMTAVF